MFSALCFLGLVNIPCSLAQKVIRFTEENGLPSNKVYMVTQDVNGFIWCTTDRGIAMYNGENFTTYTTKNGLPINDMWKIYSSEDGKIWFFGKSNELGYIQNGKVYSFPSEQGKVLSPERFFFSDAMIGFNQGSISYVLHEGMWRKHELNDTLMQQMMRSKKEHYVKYAFSLINSIITYQDYKISFCDMHLKVLKEYPHFNKEWDSRINNIWNGLYEGNKKFYLIIKDLLYIFDLQKKSVKIKPLPNRSTGLKVDAENGQVILNGSAGKYLVQDDSIIELIAPFELGNIEAQGYFEDSLGNIWISTLNDGILKYPVSNKSKIFFSGSNVQEIEKANEMLYCAVENSGFYKIGKEGNPHMLGAENSQFYHLDLTPGQSINISTNKEIFALEGDHIVRKFFSYHWHYFFAKVLNAKCYFEIGTDQYISARNALFHFVNEKLIGLYEFPGIYSINKYKGCIILGTTTGPKLFYNNKIYHAEYLKNKFVKKTTVFNECLLLATDGYGLHVYNNDSAYQIESSSGLSINNIYVVNDSSFWLSTNSGAHEFLYLNNTFILRRSVLQSNGLVSNMVNDLLISGDTMFCATDQGLSIVDLKKLKLTNKPNIIFRSISLNDSTYSSGENIQVVNTNNNVLRINFDIAYLNEHSQLRNTYLIEPLDQEWKPLTSNNLTIEGLKPGKYNIHIRTKGFNQNMDEKTISFEIKPRWFEQRGFIFSFVVFSIIGLLLAGYFIVSGIIRKRNKRLTLENQLVNLELYALRSKLNPHFIFNTFNSIQLYINNNQLELSEKYLILLSKHIRNVFEFSHLQKISLEKEVSLLKDYLEIEKTRFGEKINIEIVVDPRIDLTNNYIPSMIVQPYVENSMVHGLFHKEGIGHLTVQFNFLNNTSYEVKIIDDGIGFSSIASERISSTKVNTERIKLINQGKDFHIDVKKSFLDESKKDRGTVITIIVEHE
jgi:hypothetical protein